MPLSMSTKNLAWIDSNVFNSQINLKRIDICTMLSLPINEHGKSLHLFRPLSSIIPNNLGGPVLTAGFSAYSLHPNVAKFSWAALL